MIHITVFEHFKLVQQIIEYDCYKNINITKATNYI